MTIVVDAWLGQSLPIEVAQPVYRGTETRFEFTISSKDNYATKKALVSQDITFSARREGEGHSTNFIDEESCTIVGDGTGGKCECTIANTEFDFGDENCRGELNIREQGAGQPITERVVFNFYVADTLKTS